MKTFTTKYDMKMTITITTHIINSIQHNLHIFLQHFSITPLAYAYNKRKNKWVMSTF